MYVHPVAKYRNVYTAGKNWPVYIVAGNYARSYHMMVSPPDMSGRGLLKGGSEMIERHKMMDAHGMRKVCYSDDVAELEKQLEEAQKQIEALQKRLAWCYG